MTRLALRGAGPCDPLELVLELADPLLDPPPVDLQLRLTRTTPGPDAPGLLTQLHASAAETRHQVPVLRELDLQHADLARRVLGEDVEDQRDPVDDVDGEELLEVPLLGGRELVVEHHDVDVERFGQLAQLLGLAPTDIRRRVRAVAALQDGLDRLAHPRCR